MTTDYKILAQVELGELALDNSTVKEQLVYEVPSNTQFTNSSTSIVNTGNSTETYSVAVVPNSDKSTAVTNITYALPIVDNYFVGVNRLNNKSFYSQNGQDWTESTTLGSTSGGDWFVAYGNDKYVAIPAGSTVAYYSNDGISWTQTNLPDWTFAYHVVYGNGRFIATVGQTDIIYSDNGINWTRVDVGFYTNTNGLTFGGGKFVAVGNSGVGIRYSTDGLSWTQSLLPSNIVQLNQGENNWMNVAYGNGKYVVTPFIGSSGIYSTDFVTWQSFSLFSQGYWYALAYGNDKFVAIKNESSNAVYSTDGINWTETQLPYSNRRVRNIVYGNGKFVATGDQALGYYYYSTDGINWQSGMILGYTYGISNVAFGRESQSAQQSLLQSLNKHKIIYNKQILAGETHIISGGVTLNSGDQIRAKSTSSDIIVNVYGAELS